MCSHYDPVLNRNTLKQYFGVEEALPDLKDSPLAGIYGSLRSQA
jgi:hypothetical protein